eukprot:9881043-Alexandrium_andersonii.AAC.1
MGPCCPGLRGHLHGLGPPGPPPDRSHLCSRRGDAENQYLAEHDRLAPHPPGDGLAVHQGRRH